MKKTILFFFAVMLLFGSCKDFLNMPPKNLKVVYKIQDVRQAMSGFLFCTLNSRMNAAQDYSVSYNGEFLYPPFGKYAGVVATMYSDDIDMYNFIDPTLSNFARAGQTYTADYKEAREWKCYLWADRLWYRVFQNVGYLNSVLSDLSKVPDYDQVIGEQIKGEAKIIRAYYLLRLNQLFAPYQNNDYGIPYNLDAEIYKGGPRKKQTELYKELIAELMEVLDYTSPAKKGWNLFYNDRVIYGILAQTYMYKAESCAKESSDWQNAKKYAQLARNNEGIESTVEQQTTMVIVPGVLVNENPSQFCVLRYNRQGDSGSSGDNNFAPWGNPYAAPYLVQRATPELYAMYDDNDIRKTSFFKIQNEEPYIMKGMPTNGYVDNYAEQHSLFRFSDMMLIEAEAMARMGEAGAVALLNEFKAAKIPGYLGYTGNDVLGEILKERRKEFCYEEQMRFIDMKRLGVSLKRLTKNLDDNIDETFELSANDYRYSLPIPVESELENNPIAQNPGWVN